MMALGGCEKEKVALVGDREPVLFSVPKLQIDPQIQHLPVLLPKAVINQDWPQVGGHPSHVMPPLVLNHTLSLLWSNNTIAGSNSERRLLSGPVSDGQHLYALSADGEVMALSHVNGEVAWRADIVPEGESRNLLGGGVAYAKGSVFVTTPFNQVFCLEASNGKIKWQQSVNSPVRTSPTVREDRVFVVTINNELQVFDAISGQSLWHHNGLVESAGLLGGAAPAVGEGVVVVPYSSGEIYALRVDNGYQLWADNLFSTRHLDAVSTMAQIKARPIINQGIVYVVSHGGRMAAIDLRSGRRLWDLDIAAIRTPAVVGDFIFVITLQNELICLHRETGAVRWVRALPKGRGDISWAGPLVTGDALLIVGSDGRIVQLQAADGKVISQISTDNAIKISPMVAGKTLFILHDNGQLSAYQ
jgi:outer membrane protein assembly factor BamB